MLRNGTRDHSEEAIDRARELRTGASASERILWELLRKRRLGRFMFRRQYAVKPYWLDFYCPEAKLCIEVDGDQHTVRAHEDETRDLYLERLGILTIRIPSLLLFNGNGMEAQAALERIEAICRERSGIRD